MGGQWHCTSRRIHILYGKGNENHELGTRFLQEPHGVTTQKTPFFIVTAVKTSNLTP
jgi:hypothetical protein